MICDQFSSCLLKDQSNGSNRCNKCRSEDCRSIITCKENGKRYILHNDEKYTVSDFLVDGGVFVNEVGLNKCDRLVLVQDPDRFTVFLIELKGKNVRHAIEQLYDTAHMYKKELVKMRTRFRVVCTSVPNMANDSKTTQLKEEIYRVFGSLPVVRECTYEEWYSKVE